MFWMFIGYISSTSRISAENTSSIACTPLSASACALSAAFLSASGPETDGLETDDGGLETAGCGLATDWGLETDDWRLLSCIAVTAILRPPAWCASDSSHALF